MSRRLTPSCLTAASSANVSAQSTTGKDLVIRSPLAPSTFIDNARSFPLPPLFRVMNPRGALHLRLTAHRVGVPGRILGHKCTRTQHNPRPWLKQATNCLTPRQHGTDPTTHEGIVRDPPLGHGAQTPHVSGKNRFQCRHRRDALSVLLP